MITVNDLIESNLDVYDVAVINHEFLKSVKYNIIRLSQFNTWLVQDYLFAKGFTKFCGLVLSKAPTKDIEFFLSSLV